MKLRSQELCQGVLFGLIENVMGKYQSRKGIKSHLGYNNFDIFISHSSEIFWKIIEYVSLKISYISGILGLEVPTETYGI